MEIALISPHDEVFNIITNLSLFEGLDDQTLKQVASSAELRVIEKDEWAIHTGERGEHLYFLLKGRLQVIDTTEDGREIGIRSEEHTSELPVTSLSRMPSSA